MHIKSLYHVHGKTDTTWSAPRNTAVTVLDLKETVKISEYLSKAIKDREFDGPQTFARTS